MKGFKKLHNLEIFCYSKERTSIVSCKELSLEANTVEQKSIFNKIKIMWP
jgi:hypothetical protein